MTNRFSFSFKTFFFLSNSLLIYLGFCVTPIYAEGPIDWEQEQKKQPIQEYVSLKAKPNGLVNPPRFATDYSQEGILHRGEQYFYGSFQCNTKKGLLCLPYLALLRVSKNTGLATSVLKKQVLPVHKLKKPEFYGMSPLRLVDIDQDGTPEIIMTYRVVFNNQPGYGSQTLHYRAIFSNPDLALMLLAEEGSSSSVTTCHSSWNRLASVHQGKPDLQSIQTCKSDQETYQTKETFCFKERKYSSIDCKP